MRQRLQWRLVFRVALPMQTNRTLHMQQLRFRARYMVGIMKGAVSSALGAAHSVHWHCRAARHVNSDQPHKTCYVPGARLAMSANLHLLGSAVSTERST